MASTTSCIRTEEETLYWLALAVAPGLGPRPAAQLVRAFGSPAGVFRASAEELEAAGAHPGVARSLSSGCVFEEATEQHSRLKSRGAALIALDEPEYPALLREIYDPPLVLFAQGRLDMLARVKVALVGSRRATPYGLAVAEKLGRDLANEGITVVSGMARGIDTAAHRGALEGPGRTIAVFGCGLDVVYPSENRKLAEEIARAGLLLTEFHFGAPAYPQNFPIRNRVVSGLSSGVVVIEGAQYSGSSITARLALDQDREVFAVPGNVTSRMSWGPNLLIKQGAQLVQNCADVVDGLSLEDRKRLVSFRSAGGEHQENQQPDLPFGPMTGLAVQVLGMLRVDVPATLDQILESGLEATSSEIISILFELEMAGRVKTLPGRSYVKVWVE